MLFIRNGHEKVTVEVTVEGYALTVGANVDVPAHVRSYHLRLNELKRKINKYC